VNTHHLHRIVVAGRDTCNGSCQASAGCDCCGQWPEPIPVQPAECCTELGAEPRGKHRDSALKRFALWLRRALG
jgi:hypothetical protein